jgi:hypothetical protein
VANQRTFARGDQTAFALRQPRQDQRAPELLCECVGSAASEARNNALLMWACINVRESKRSLPGGFSKSSTLGPVPPSLESTQVNEAAIRMDTMQPATDVRRHFVDASLNEEFCDDDHNSSNERRHGGKQHDINNDPHRTLPVHDPSSHLSPGHSGISTKRWQQPAPIWAALAPAFRYFLCVACHFDNVPYG